MDPSNIISILKKHSSKGLKIHPDISPTHKRRAVDLFPMPENAEIYGFIDTTRIGSGKRGLAITNYGIYWKNDFLQESQTHNLTWKELFACHKKISAFLGKLTFDTDIYFCTYYNKMKVKSIRIMLLDIIDLYQKTGNDDLSNLSGVRYFEAGASKFYTPDYKLKNKDIDLLKLIASTRIGGVDRLHKFYHDLDNVGSERLTGGTLQDIINNSLEGKLDSKITKEIDVYGMAIVDIFNYPLIPEGKGLWEEFAQLTSCKVFRNKVYIDGWGIYSISSGFSRNEYLSDVSRSASFDLKFLLWKDLDNPSREFFLEKHGYGFLNDILIKNEGRLILRQDYVSFLEDYSSGYRERPIKIRIAAGDSSRSLSKEMV